MALSLSDLAVINCAWWASFKKGGTKSLSITPVMRKLIDNGMENLGNALALLMDMTTDSLSNEQVARRLEVYAIALSQFTGCSTFSNISISAHGKFGKTWRELLEIAVAMYGKMSAWHEAGYDFILFMPANRGCRPCRGEDVELSSLEKKYSVRLFTGSWEALTKMVAVYCHGDVIEDPPKEIE